MLKAKIRNEDITRTRNRAEGQLVRVIVEQRDQNSAGKQFRKGERSTTETAGRRKEQEEMKKRRSETLWNENVGY